MVAFSLNPAMPLDYLVLLLIIAAGASAVLAWRSAHLASRPARVGITALRFFGFALIGLIALNPGQWKRENPETGKELYVLVDASASMRVEDSQVTDRRTTRWADARRIAEEVTGALKDQEDLDVRLFTFTDKVEALEDGQTADPAKALAQLRRQEPGEFGETDILGATRTLLDLAGGRQTDLRGIVLLSDGRRPRPADHGPVTLLARSRGTPILTTALGGAVGKPDLVVEPTRLRFVGFPGQKTLINARIENRNLGRISPEIRLEEPGGDVIERQRIDLEPGTETRVTFTLMAEDVGLRQYVLAADQMPGESDVANNRVALSVHVLEGRTKVLLTEGVPFWDTKFLVQLLRQEPHLDVTSIYRLTADRYIRVATSLDQAFDSNQPLFPKTRQELYLYDIIMLGKGAEYFLSPDQIAALRDFVAENGGCLIFFRGKPYATDMPGLKALEPVVWGEPMTEEFDFRPTQAGRYAGMFEQYLPGPDDPLWQALPALSKANSVDRLAGFAEVLVEGRMSAGTGADRAFPLMISRRFGDGLVVTVNADGFWRWDFFPVSEDAAEIYKAFWTQFLQWAATYSEFLPGRNLALRIEKDTAFPGQDVELLLARRTLDALPGELRVWKGRDQVKTLRVDPPHEQAERWRSSISFEEPGHYILELLEAGSPDAAAGADPENETSVVAAVTVRGWPGEQDDLSADPAFLERLAVDSGGSLVSPADLPAKVLELAHGEIEKPQNHSDVRWETLWDSPWLFALILGCFTGEWVLRRRSGLL